MTGSEESKRATLREFLGTVPRGADSKQLEDLFPGETRQAVSLMILKEIRAGEIWVHAGKFYSRENFELMTGVKTR